MPPTSQPRARGLHIGTRLALGFGLLIAMMLVMVVVGFVGLTNISNSNKTIATTSKKATMAISSIIYLWF